MPELAGFTPAFLAFLRGLRRLGFALGPEEISTAIQALACIGVEHPQLALAAVEAAVVRQPEQIPLFRAAWQQFLVLIQRAPDPWLSQNTLTANIARMRQERLSRPSVIWMGAEGGAADAPRDGDDPDLAPDLAVRRGASRDERLQHADFARLTPMEQREMRRTRGHLPTPSRVGHRWATARHGRQLDLSAMAEAARATGEWYRLRYRGRKVVPRPVVILCDVSGSMEPYSRLLLRFAHTLLAQRARVEVFVFSTRLTRITRALRMHDPDRALEDALRLTPDYAGGTRIGEAVRTFNLEWSRRILRRGARVWLVTDGFDTGAPDLLGAEVQRLRKLARGLFWLTPTLADPAYQPVTTAAQTLVAAVDAVFPAYSWHTLEQTWRSTAMHEAPARAGLGALKQHRGG